MRILEVEHGGHPAEGLVKLATDGYVGIEPRNLRGDVVHRLREGLSVHGNPYELVKSGLEEYARSCNVRLFDMIFMGNFLGSPPNLHDLHNEPGGKARTEENWTRIFGNVASLLSEAPESRVWVVEYITPPKNKRSLETGCECGVKDG